MIQLSRRLTKQLRAVLRQSIVEQASPAAWPLLHCQTNGAMLTIHAQANGVGVRFQIPNSQPPDTMAFSSSVLKEFEGRQEGITTLEFIAPGKGQAKWQDSSRPHTLDFETTEPPKVPPFSDLPTDLVPAKEGFLAALADAGTITASIAARFALNRLVLRGREGQIVASDGRQLLIQSGFSFPWQESLLIPRITAFGSKEIQQIGKVKIGATDQHVVVQTGPWTFLLATDKSGRYPDVYQVIPKPASLVSRLRLSGEDIQSLLERLPSLPGSAEEGSPITLDLQDPICLRARGETSEAIQEIVLSCSQREGPPVRLSFNRNFLRRALQLGFTELSVGRGEGPVVFSDKTRSYLFIPLEARTALPPTSTASVPPKPDPSRRQATVSAPPPHQPNATNGTPSTERLPSIPELLLEAEGLRNSLQDLLGRLTRLIGGLKQHRRQSRVVQAAMQSLRQLHLND